MKKYKIQCINGIIEEFIVEAQTEEEAKKKLFDGDFIEHKEGGTKRKIQNVEVVGD